MGEASYVWQVEELQKLGTLQPDKVHEALKVLWKDQPDLWRTVVVNAYLSEKISLGKAAGELGMTRRELEADFIKKGLPLRHPGPEDIQAEVGTIIQW